MEGVEDVCFCYLPNHQITLKTVNLASDSDQNVVVPRSTPLPLFFLFLRLLLFKIDLNVVRVYRVRYFHQGCATAIDQSNGDVSGLRQVRSDGGCGGGLQGS
jgi:hypothetical protein